MNSSKFSKTPATNAEKEKRAEAFINLADDRIDRKTVQAEKPKKEKTKTLYLRAPASLWEDIHNIMTITGLSMNAVCLELLRPEIKRKLKELNEN